MPTNTLSDLRSRLITRLGVASGDVSNADALFYLNTAKRDVQEEIDLYYSEANTTFATTAGTIAYSLPSDYRSTIALWYLDGDARTLLTPITRVTEVWLFPPKSGETRQAPEAYLRLGSQIRLRPVPDAAYTIQHDYWKYLADLSADTDNDSITNNHPMLLLARAAESLAEDRNWQQLAAYWHKQYLDHLRRVNNVMRDEETQNAVVISRGPHTVDAFRRRSVRWDVG